MSIFALLVDDVLRLVVCALITLGQYRESLYGITQNSLILTEINLLASVLEQWEVWSLLSGFY